MKILFHVGVGNTDRPFRWSFVNGLFSNLARTLENLGHECLVWSHIDAQHSNVYKNNIKSRDVSNNELSLAKAFKPDWVFTWNGNSDGDKLMINEFGRENIIFAELGFFDHYTTVFFDFKGVNGDSENLEIDLLPFNEKMYQELKSKYQKPRLYNGDFIFVPLQDEQDTNITLHSPIKKMDDLLQYVEDKIEIGDGVKVLFKQHPKARCQIKPRNNFIEVTEDVHHYIPYAKQIIGINSTVLLESLIYTNNVITLGKGITSREFKNDENKQFITHLKSKQFYWEELNNVETIKNSYFYNKMINK
jgi:hypothetical protein